MSIADRVYYKKLCKEDILQLLFSCSMYKLILLTMFPVWIHFCLGNKTLDRITDRILSIVGVLFPFCPPERTFSRKYSKIINDKFLPSRLRAISRKCLKGLFLKIAVYAIFWFSKYSGTMLRNALFLDDCLVHLPNFVFTLFPKNGMIYHMFFSLKLQVLCSTFYTHATILKPKLDGSLVIWI